MGQMCNNFSLTAVHGHFISVNSQFYAQASAGLLKHLLLILKNLHLSKNIKRHNNNL